LLCHCSKVENGAIESAASGAEGSSSEAPPDVPEIPEIPPLGPVRYSDCLERRTPLSDPSVRGLAQEHDLTLDLVLARVKGDFTSTVRWPASGGAVNAAPESGDVPVTIRVDYSGGPAAYVQPVSSEGDLLDPENSSCPDRVEVEVDVSVQTVGGALDEQFTAVAAIEQYIGEIRHRTLLRSLGGSLVLSPPSPEGNRRIVLGPELDFFIKVSELGTTGGLSVVVREFTDGVDATKVPEDRSPLERFAVWPAIEDCTLLQMAAPLDRSFGGVSPRHVLEIVAEQSVPFSWADGSATNLVLSPTPSSNAGCAQEDRGVVHFWFDAAISPDTADGGLGGVIPGAVHLVGYPDRVTAVFQMNHSAAREQLTALLPTSADASRYDGGFVEFSVTHYFAWPEEEWLGAEGALTVTVVDPACDTDECDGVALSEGRIPPEAAAPETAE
jgi:hypothetical protein